jgi:basic amino acid/polyamine antiporter, APA family
VNSDAARPAAGGHAAARPALRRAVTFWPLVFYGLSDIIGAGIYVAIGEVMARAGAATPIAFLLAGAAAGLTGLCYAALASRFPEAAGAASYVKRVFGSDLLAQLVGGTVALSVAITTAAIASGAVQYLAVLVHAPAPLLTAGIVLCFTAVAVAGVRESVGLAVALGLIELGGLIAAIAAGFRAAPSLDVAAMLPTDAAGWGGAVAGAFIAFFAFLGFETMANMAEEVKDSRRIVPRAILGAIGISIVLYVLVAISITASDQAGDNPLLDLFNGRNATIFALASTLAIANGVLVGVVMLARLFYGMARNGQLPAMLAAVSARTRTPIAATVLAGGFILVTALSFPFAHLLVWTNALTLAVFTVVDLALWRLQHRTGRAKEGFGVPRLVAPLAAAISLAMMIAEFLA